MPATGWTGLVCVRGVGPVSTSGSVDAYYGGAAYWGGNAVVRADNQMLVTYMNGVGGAKDLMLAVVESEETFRTTHNVASLNESVFQTLNDAPVAESNQCMLLDLTDGSILLFVVDAGVPGSVPARIRVYRSTNGLGTDFVLHGTVQSVSYSGTIAARASLGVPVQLPGGRILLPGRGFALSGTQLVNVATVFWSDDGGATWSQTSSALSGNRTIPKGIARFANGLFMFGLHDFAGLSTRLIKSADNGQTWTTVASYAGPGILWGYGGGMYYSRYAKANWYSLVRADIDFAAQMSVYSRQNELSLPEDETGISSLGTQNNPENGVWRWEAPAAGDDAREYMWTTRRYVYWGMGGSTGSTPPPGGTLVYIRSGVFVPDSLDRLVPPLPHIPLEWREVPYTHRGLM